MKTNYRFCLLLASVMAISACSSKNIKKDKRTDAGNVNRPVAEASLGQGNETYLEEEEATEASLRGKDFQPLPELANVYFDFDKYELRPEALETLAKNANWLKSHSSIEAQIAGHCDERGTIEYNIALGQHRANAIKNYYKMLGIPLRRLSTISYGKERPVCNDSNEECWQKNRRAETLVKTGTGGK